LKFVPRPLSVPVSTIDFHSDRLLQEIESYGSCAVAFSGGVDSAVVAKAAQLALGERALAVTGKSSSLAKGELEIASEVAELIGIRHVVIDTEEFARPEYIRNAPDRCYHCKTELYSLMAARQTEWNSAVICNGANLDDLGDFRPGRKAAGEHGVCSPLAECGMQKADVRHLAQHWKLPVWDKPATPCLSSRVAYGDEVTPERLQMIDRAEEWLRSRGLPEIRVRYHRGELARVEVPVDSLARLVDAPLRSELIEMFKSLGFRFVTLDLEGFRSGSLNQLVSLERLREE